MESYISKDAPEPGQLTAGSTSPTVEGLTGVTVVGVMDSLEDPTLLRWFDSTPYVDPSPDFHKTRVIPPPPRRRVETAIRKTVCAIRHVPSGEYVTRGFRGTTKDPLKIRFWDRKCDALKVLTNWLRNENDKQWQTIPYTDYEFIEREVFLPSTETF
jgi:hypothetical protein